MFTTTNATKNFKSIRAALKSAQAAEPTKAHTVFAVTDAGLSPVATYTACVDIDAMIAANER